jgi:dTDP-4-dehydrorhamnose reductase
MPKFVIIGSTGQLAADLLRVFGASAGGLTRQELDVTDDAQTLVKLQALKPDWVINTASFNRVDDCEIEPARAFEVNALGAFNAARAAAAVAAGVVFFSTDYVFGNEERRASAFAETDVPAPLNVYGTSKCAGEHLVRLANPRHLIIRTAGLYGAVGSRKGWTFPQLVLEQARTAGEVRVVSDQVVSPTYTADLAVTVKQLVERDLRGLFHVTNAGQCSWFEFAREVLALAGVGARLIPIRTEQSERRARRPAFSALASIHLHAVGLAPLRSWKDALRDYLRERGELH